MMLKYQENTVANVTHLLQVTLGQLCACPCVFYLGFGSSYFLYYTFVPEEKEQENWWKCAMSDVHYYISSQAWLNPMLVLNCKPHDNGLGCNILSMAMRVKLKGKHYLCGQDYLFFNFYLPSHKLCLILPIFALTFS